MAVAAKLDEFGRGAWIVASILGFMIFPPLGFVVLIYAFWSGRMGCGWNGGMDRYERKMAHLQQKMERFRSRNFGGGGFGGSWGGPPSSGNRAFDDYRAETLRRLEDEYKEFQDFLEQLRRAKDKAEFDQFMASRRGAAIDQPPAQA